MNKKDLFALFKISFKDWLEDNAPLRAAALTFFIILPLPSLLLFIETFFALFFGQTQGVQQLVQQITALAGPAVAALFKDLLSNSTSPFSSVWPSITIVAFSLAGAIGTFAVLRDTMDVIWEVKETKKQKLSARIEQRLGPFVLVSALGLIVIAWTGIATPLFSVIQFYSINGTLTLITLEIAQIVLSLSLSTLLFAIIFIFIPRIKVLWQDVALPSVVTGIAFTITNYVLGLYLKVFTVTTVIGAAGSLLIILLWIFILNLIVLFGAELSKVYTSTFGSNPKEQLPEAVETMVKTIEKAEERIQMATKGNKVEWQEKLAEKLEAENKSEKLKVRNRERKRLIHRKQKTNDGAKERNNRT